MKMFYLAAMYGRRREMHYYRDDLVGLGYGVTSRWIDQDGDDEDNVQHPSAPTNAVLDLLDILASDTLITFTEKPETRIPLASRGGRHVEMGIAIGQMKEVVCIGPVENIFCTLDIVARYPSWMEYLQTLTTAGYGRWSGLDERA